MQTSRREKQSSLVHHGGQSGSYKNKISSDPLSNAVVEDKKQDQHFILSHYPKSANLLLIWQKNLSYTKINNVIALVKYWYIFKQLKKNKQGLMTKKQEKDFLYYVIFV